MNRHKSVGRTQSFGKSQDTFKDLAFPDVKLQEWSTNMQNYRHHDFDPYNITKPKIVKKSELFAKESSYNPILQQFADPLQERSMREFDRESVIQKLAQNKDKQLRVEQTFNIINQENRLKGLENHPQYPKEKQWKPRFIKNTRQDHNILSNLSLLEHHFDSPDKRPLPEQKVDAKKQGKIIVQKRNSNLLRDFDIISNRFEENHENKVIDETQTKLQKAAQKYWEKNQFDPIVQKFNDTQRENIVKTNETSKIKNHVQTYLDKLPLALQKEGTLYNPITKEVKDPVKLGEYDYRSQERIKRYEVSGIFEKIVKDRQDIKEQHSHQKLNNKISYERFSQTNKRGFDIVTQQDLNNSPNNEQKQDYYNRLRKQKLWNIINDNSSQDYTSNSALTQYPKTLLKQNTQFNSQQSQLKYDQLNKTFDDRKLIPSNRALSNIRTRTQLKNGNDAVVASDANKFEMSGFLYQTNRDQRINNNLLVRSRSNIKSNSQSYYQDKRDNTRAVIRTGAFMKVTNH
eukprot:403375727